MTVVERAVEIPPNIAALETADAPEFKEEKVTKIPHTVPRSPKNGARV